MLACSFINVPEAKAHAIKLTEYYLAGSIFLAVGLIGTDLVRKRLSAFSIVAILLVAVHPRFTVEPLYGPSCTFINVELSQVAFALIAVMTAWRVSVILRARRFVAKSSQVRFPGTK